MSEKLEMPSPSEVLNAIEKWRELDLRTETRDCIQRRFDELFSDIIRGFHTKAVDGSKVFYRIRKMEKYLIGRESELWAPPAKNTNKGRCNYAGEPMLYASFDGATCFEELGIQEGEQVYVIKYKKRIDQKLKLRRVYGKSADLNGHGESLLSEDGFIAYKIIREFLRSEFTKPTCSKCDGSDFVYNTSAAICEFMMIQQSDLDGIVYPSVAKQDCENVALFPERAKEKLKIDEVRVVRVVSGETWRGQASHGQFWRPILDGKMHYTHSYYKGDISDDRITWIPSGEIRAS